MELLSTLEQNNVYNTYTQIAKHFSATREKIWPSVIDFYKKLANNSLILDAGCGNGKNLLINKELLQEKNFKFIAFDLVPNFVNITKQRVQEYYDNTDIINPVENIYTSNILDISNEETNKFDAVISVAVIHHLDTEEKRILSIKECLRVLKPKGLFMFQVWSYEQDRDSKFKFDIGDNNVEWKVLKRQITKDTNKKDKNDIKEVHNRYYYIHNEELLKNMLNKVVLQTNCKIINYYNQKGNWIVILEK